MRSPIRPKSWPPAETFALPVTKHQADLASAGLVRNRVARLQPVEVEADIGPAGVFRRHMGDAAVAGLLLHQQLGHRAYSFWSPAARPRIDRLVEIEELPDRIDGEARRDGAPEGRAGDELEDRPRHADDDDGDAPPQRPEKRMFVVLHSVQDLSGCRKTLRLDRIACRRHDAHQFLVADLRHLQRRVLLRVLLGLDHEPALISIVGKFLDDRAEIERAVAGHGEGAERHRVEEGLLRAVEPRR